MNDCMRCWEAILPHTVRHSSLTVDLMCLLEHYQKAYAGAMYSGCGGGYLFVASENTVPGASACSGASGEGAGERFMREVVVTGGFDNLSARKVRFLHEASRFGRVHVYLWADEVIQDLTGAPPAFPLDERLYLLESLRFVKSCRGRMAA